MFNYESSKQWQINPGKEGKTNSSIYFRKTSPQCQQGTEGTQRYVVGRAAKMWHSYPWIYMQAIFVSLKFLRIFTAIKSLRQNWKYGSRGKYMFFNC